MADGAEVALRAGPNGELRYELAIAVVAHGLGKLDELVGVVPVVLALAEHGREGHGDQLRAVIVLVGRMALFVGGLHATAGLDGERCHVTDPFL